MPRMQFALASYLGEPEVPCINMIPEANPAEEKGVILKSRAGLRAVLGSVAAPVDALFSRDGVLSGAWLSVSGGALYSGVTSVGAIDGAGVPSIAGNEIGAMVTAGATLKYYNGTSLASVSFPDSASVADVTQGASRFFAIRANTGKLYWTPALAATFAALNFATAESAPDKLLQILWLDDKAILFGQETVEIWVNADDDALPIQPIESLVFEKGLKAKGCATLYDFGFAFVGNDNGVYIGAGKPEPIAEPWLNRKIAASTSCRLFNFFLPDGREALCLRINNESHVFVDGNWCEFQSYDAANWLPQCYAKGVFGCSDGRFAEWSTNWLDLDGILERRWRGGFPLNSRGVSVNDITLRCKTGQTTYLTGDYANPPVEMRLSRNLGRTWGDWRSVSLGTQGQYGKRVQWRGCGMASAPGLLAEWRVTAPIDCDVRDIIINDGFGGRAA